MQQNVKIKYKPIVKTISTGVVLWVKSLSLGFHDQKVGGSNPHDGVSSRCLVPAPAKLAVQKHVKVQVDTVFYAP